MSIIYDALKKVEKSVDQNKNAQPQRDEAGGIQGKVFLPRSMSLKLRIGLILFLFAALGSLSIGAYLNLLAKQLAYKKMSLSQAKPLPSSPVQYKPVSQIPLQPSTLPPVSQGSISDASEVKASGTPETSSVPIAPPKNRIEKLILSGVFYSEGQGYALINNQILQVGDVVEGLTLKKVTLEGVELERQDGSLNFLSNKK